MPHRRDWGVCLFVCLPEFSGRDFEQISISIFLFQLFRKKLIGLKKSQTTPNQTQTQGICVITAIFELCAKDWQGLDDSSGPDELRETY